jgi:cobalt-zinc-cadmium efflux system protein
MTDCTHHSDNSEANRRRLLLAFAVITTFMVVEAVGGVLSGSLALLADAAHMLTDAFALGLAASAQVFAMRPADASLHFGYRRAQVLAAFVNGVLLIVLIAWIIFEAVRRFLSPIDVDASLMLWIAAIGLLANVAAFLILHRPGERDLNVRGALLHVIGDLLGSAAAIIAAIVIALTGWVRIDPILSIIVAILIGFSAVRLLRETGLILLEGAPKNIDVEALKKGLRSASSTIKDVHHVRISQLTPDHPRITLHVCVDQTADAPSAMKAVKDYLSAHFNLHDSTVQIDVGDECPDYHLDAPKPRSAATEANADRDRHAPTSALAANER